MYNKKSNHQFYVALWNAQSYVSVPEKKNPIPIVFEYLIPKGLHLSHCAFQWELNVQK